MAKNALNEVFQNYLRDIKEELSKEGYTEFSLRTPFQNFINSLLRELNLPYKVQHEKKKMQGLGAPDFTVFKGAAIGYIEAKDIDKDLVAELKSEQIKKYSAAIPNIILTNYRDFVLIRNNSRTDKATLFPEPDVIIKYGSIKDADITDLLRLFVTFLDYDIPTIRDANELAEALARRARLLKDLAREQLEEDFSTFGFDLSVPLSGDYEPSSIYDFHKILQELLKDPTAEKSIKTTVDAYAQTITYGLFLARYYHDGKLERETAYRYIPQKIRIIRTIFRNIANEDKLPSNVAWIVDELVNVLNATNLEEALSRTSKDRKTVRDPFYMFYEHFLDLYDPVRRKSMGVYYTPSSVVHFIVRSINSILKSDFNKRFGYRDESVTLLDPAVGTGAFLSSAFTTMFDEMREEHLGGVIRKKVESHVLKNFYGFEILITPYIIAHIKLFDILRRYYDFKEEDRVQVYLTDTLNPSEKHVDLSWFRDLGAESKFADEIKCNKRILVILGNPPYLGASRNKGKWITDLLRKGYTRSDGSKDEGYYVVDGEPLGERNSKWLQDDYVKFIRFAQWKIDSTEGGIIGFITNHSYLDNVAFRGLRQSLLYSFNRIYILNLHGNLRTRERSPDGSKDENVFNITPGVAIALFVKNEKFEDRKVLYADLYGLREQKYDWLESNSVDTVAWQEIVPKSPHYLLVPTQSGLQDEYEKYWKVTDIFPTNGVGLFTARDSLAIKYTREQIWETVSDFVTLDPEEARQKYKLGNDAQDWKVALAQKDLKDSGLSVLCNTQLPRQQIKPILEQIKSERIKPILYRPFDVRYTYYTGISRGFHCRPRPRLMPHMMRDNVALCVGRAGQAVGADSEWNLVFCSQLIEDLNLFYRGGCVSMPLFLYQSGDKSSLDVTGGGKKELNIKQEVVNELTALYGAEFSPENILGYIYAILHSNSYRTRYAEDLKRDFPRIPFVKDVETFKSLANIGRSLLDLHLMKIELAPSSQFDVDGSNVIDFVKYKDFRVAINSTQYFDGIPQDAWGFYIGGYQVLDKWLKDRKGRELEGSEIEHFMQVVEVIKKTIEYMQEVDRSIHFPL